jgi:hypothetical protein
MVTSANGERVASKLHSKRALDNNFKLPSSNKNRGILYCYTFAWFFDGLEA